MIEWQLESMPLSPSPSIVTFSTNQLNPPTMKNTTTTTTKRKIVTEKYHNVSKRLKTSSSSSYKEALIQRIMAIPGLFGYIFQFMDNDYCAAACMRSTFKKNNPFHNKLTTWPDKLHIVVDIETRVVIVYVLNKDITDCCGVHIYPDKKNINYKFTTRIENLPYSMQRHVRVVAFPSAIVNKLNRHFAAASALNIWDRCFNAHTAVFEFNGEMARSLIDHNPHAKICRKRGFARIVR